MQKSIKTLAALIAVCFSISSLADDDYELTSDTSYIDGELETRQHIYYPGDTLDVRVSFEGETELLASQGVDIYLVIQDSTQNSTVIAIDNYQDFASMRMFYLEDVSPQTLPEGVYQLALILTRPGGDPLSINDWYNGFAGLLDTDSIRSSESSLDNDFDQDGEYDDDYDRDGFHGDDDDEHEYYELNAETDSSGDRDWDDDDWDDDDDDDDDDDN